MDVDDKDELIRLKGLLDNIEEQTVAIGRWVGDAQEILGDLVEDEDEDEGEREGDDGDDGGLLIPNIGGINLAVNEFADNCVEYRPYIVSRRMLRKAFIDGHNINAFKLGNKLGALLTNGYHLTGHITSLILL